MSQDDSCLLRRVYDPAALLAKHPPILRHPHKRLVFGLSCPPGAVHRGPLGITRWRAATLPERLTTPEPEILESPGYFDYAGDHRGVWHLNFADPRLFAAYGSALLAQDELQAAEHPALGSLREALIAEGERAITEDEHGPTPVLVTNVERRCVIDTAPTADSPLGLYGNRFAAASPDVVRRAVRVLEPPTLTNLVAIAAPQGGRGPYWRKQLVGILVTAFTGFRAAREESRLLWPDASVEIRTGFWGCGAFGGNRRAMTLLQLLAARMAGADRVRFYVFDAAGSADFRAGVADLASVVAPGGTAEEVLDRIEDLDYDWGVSDGN